MANGVIVVDMQRGFLEEASKLIPKVQALFKEELTKGREDDKYGTP